MINLTITPAIWLIIIIIAVALDYIVGDPKFLVHPVQLIGYLINFLNTFLNRGKHKKFKGAILVIITLSVTFVVFYYLQLITLYFNYFLYLAINTWFLSTAISVRSLSKHCLIIKRNLEEKNLEEARINTSKIVGRDTQRLNKPEIIKAVVESEAESCIDGIISPLYFMGIGIITSIFLQWLNPLTVAYIYKAVNTLDSMVGYRFEPYKDYGYFSAIADDLCNFIPARIGSLIMLVAGGLLGYNFSTAYQIFKNDRLKHLSPNAGHGEAVMSGLLGLRLGGPSYYNGNEVIKPYIGIDYYNFKIDDITDALRIDEITELIFLVLIVAVFCLIYILNLIF